ncbi:unnamed protein product, partial [Polarella glacialis]
VIAFYFSAHWCPPCRQFTPLLKKFQETLLSHGEKSLKIIFVSSDHSEHDMWKYMYDCHGDWLALSFNCKDLKDRLSRQYQVSGVPALVVIDAVGRQAVRDARGEVMSASSSSSTQVLTTYLAWKGAAGVGAPAGGQAQSSCSALPPGARVKVRGLTGAPEHNGSEGVARSYDASKQRYLVELGEKQLALRAGNLLQMLTVKARSEPSADSKWVEAVIVDYDEASGEFDLRGPEVSSRAKAGDIDKMLLNTGAIVVVHGLQAESAKQWNEHNGKVLEFDEAAQRYLVQVAPGTNLKIRPENIRLYPLV